MVARQVADPLNIRLPAARLEVRKNFFTVRFGEKLNMWNKKIKNERSSKLAYTRYSGTNYSSQAQIRPCEAVNLLTGRDWTSHSPKGPTCADGNQSTSILVSTPQMDLLAVLRIREVYPGSRILIFTHPGSRISDPGSRISAPGSKNSNKREGSKKNLLSYLFM